METSLPSIAPPAGNPGLSLCADPYVKARTALRYLLIAGALVYSSLMLNGTAAVAAPMTPIQPVLNGSQVHQVHYSYCRRWYRECRYRWGAGWRFRRCMRLHGC